ncbi:MAG: TonB-dependent receptor, partial [Vicinamibacterales bacterium]
MFTILAACAAVGRAEAQLTESTLTGTVIDATGQSIPYAAVSVLRQDTGERRDVTGDRDGSFTLAGLTPGSYDVQADSDGFRTARQSGLRLPVGQTTVTIRLDLAALQESVNVSAAAITIATSSEARLADSFTSATIQELPLAQRDIFGLTRLSAGATLIPGSANSTKLTSSPVVTVNGNRYRGNNYVLDGAMNSNPNNSGEPAIVPSLESVDEVQVQTLNFASEFGRGNGSVVNVRTRSGSNRFSGRGWEFHRGSALNARNYFATQKPDQNYNQFGGNLGGPVMKDRTFFFVNYEGARESVGRPNIFQVETPEFRNYVLATAPNSVAARLLQRFPAPTPLPGINGQQYLDQRNLATPLGTIPAIGRAAAIVDDRITANQHLVRVDHTLTSNDRLSARWIGETQSDEGGTSAAPATVGRAMRGSRGPFTGFFGNLNLGYMRVSGKSVNDLRASLAMTDATRGSADAVVPTITVTGITAPFGDVFLSGTGLRTIEVRNVRTQELGKHSLRIGAEVRRITKNLAIGPASTGTFTFNSIADFAADRPFRQTLTVDPTTGEPVGFPRHFTQNETGLFIQDQWTISPGVSLSLGVRHDYFGTVTERDGLLSSVILGPGATFAQQVATASVGRVDALYTPQRMNISPRVGLAIDPFRNGRTSMRSGFSRAFQPHHGQSISGARALPPDAL